jgi:hypothetical protein
MIKSSSRPSDMRMDGRLGRDPLKVALGDALHRCTVRRRHNLCLILAALRLLCIRLGLSAGGYRGTGSRSTQSPTGLRLRADHLV